MRTIWAKRLRQVLLSAGLLGAGMFFVGCADEYAAYPGYHGGYYASYSSAPYPYYGGYGYPYRAYGPYYGGPAYGYGGSYPGYGGASVVVSRSSSYGYRGQSGRWHNRRQVNRNTNRVRTTTTRNTRTGTRTQVQPADSDDERRYYTPR